MRQPWYRRGMCSQSRRAILGIAIACLSWSATSATAMAQRVEGGRLQLQGVPFELRVEAPPDVSVRVDGQPVETRTDGDMRIFELRRNASSTLRIDVGERTATHAVHVLPGWVSLLPPLLAILLALLLRQVLLALFAGVWLGAFLVEGFDPVAASLRAVDRYAVEAAADSDHAAILLFSLALGGMIGVITRSGGASGIAAWVTRRANTPERGQLATWALGLVVFFDDYANSLLVGSSMRPITDKLRVSREKLAFLVDATAAPVSSIALVSSWIGVEVGYIGDQLAEQNLTIDPYLAFLKTLPYRFYPWLMLFFGLAIVVLKKDFGPMRHAETRARMTGMVSGPAARPASDFDSNMNALSAKPRALLAIVPVITVVMVAMVGMYLDGRATVLAEGGSPTLRAAFGSASSIKALLWAATAGGAVALLGSLATRALTLTEAMDAWIDGLKSMLLACVILVLAWSLGRICKEVHTASYVIQLIGDDLPAGLLPAAVFVIAAAVSFATGTSWGTMAILFPLVVPLAVHMAPEAAAKGDLALVLGAISSILAGSVWGDHCSPISDTTIMSSMAASCDHVDHVRTQLPYALSVGFVALLFGEVATGLGLYPAWVGLLLGAAALVALIYFVGKPLPTGPPREPQSEAAVTPLPEDIA